MKRNFSEKIFEGHFSQILVFEDFWKSSFPESRGDLFVTFDPLELMSFLDDCGKCFFSFLTHFPTSETAKTFSFGRFTPYLVILLGAF